MVALIEWTVCSSKNVIIVFFYCPVPPLVKIAHSQQIIGASKGGSALLQCYIEAYPEPFVEWIFGEAKVLVEGGRLNISEEVLDWRLGEAVSRRALLAIASPLAAEDYGTYRCQARNNRGRTYGIISLIGMLVLLYFRHLLLLCFLASRQVSCYAFACYLFILYSIAISFNAETDATTTLENDTLKKNSFVYYGEVRSFYLFAFRVASECNHFSRLLMTTVQHLSSHFHAIRCQST